jgi:sulfite reductase (NADPH) flavoprotein alpha-component
MPAAAEFLSPALQRLFLAGTVVLAYLVLCGLVFQRERLRRQQTQRDAAALAPAQPDSRPVLVAYASQTGAAEQLAWQTARLLHDAGMASRIVALNEMQASDLAQAESVLFIASTCGEGDAPDNAALFVRRTMGLEREALPLRHLHYGLLALGDKSYKHFCGFGRLLDGWLREQGAQPLFDCVEADQLDASALQQWQRQLGRWAGTSDLPDWEAPAFERWCLAARRHLNPGSAGGPAFHIELEPQQGFALPHWESGDLLQVLAPGDPKRPREYSIASIPADGRVHLLVRQAAHVDGRLGVASGWLTHDAPIGGQVELRCRPHHHFRLGDNRLLPLILIGNGTGYAGLRSHLKARASAGTGPNWLLFGERQAAHDNFYRDEVAAWQATGVLTRCDLVYSRDGAGHRYVQDRLREQAATVRAWVDQGAAIYVCGSLDGMAAGVDAALQDILGRDGLDQLLEAGRYRRDVY